MKTRTIVGVAVVAVALAVAGYALLARLYGELPRRGEAHAVREIHELSVDEMQREATRVAALEALMRMDPDKAMPILEKIVTGEKEVSVDMRRHSIFILCRMDDERSEDLLIDLMQKEDDPELDQAAMFAIGRHGGEKAFGILANIALDPNADPELRQQALFGISQTRRDQDIIEVTVKILKSDESPEMLEASLFALSRTEGDVPDQVFMDLINNPSADEELRAQAMFFAAQRGQLDLAFVRQVYAKTESRDMKRQICHVITRMDNEEAALDALIEIIRMEEDPEIRQEAVFWVSRFDSDRAAEFLLEVINKE